MNRRFAFHAYQTVFPETRASRNAGLRSTTAILAVGAVGLAVPTWVCFRLGSDLTVVALVYLIEVVLLSLLDSLVASAVFSVIAVGCLNYFFVRPLFSLRVDPVNDVVALIAFLTASLVVTSLVQRLRRFGKVHREQAKLLELTRDSVMVRDMEDVITYWNSGAETIYGWKKDEAIGKVARSLLHTRFPSALGDINETLLVAGRWEGELINTRRDGLQAAVASRWALLRDEKGRPIAMLETSTDITERKRIEDELQRVARVTTVGELGASVAHELGQPLGAIVADSGAALRWLDRDSPEVGEALASVKRIIKEGLHAGEILRRVRMLTKRTPSQMTSLAINDVVNDVIALVQREVLNHDVTLKATLAPELPAILGDRTELAQVMINLIVNGIQAMDGVRDRPRELMIESRHGIANDLIVAVRDSGTGIDAQSADRLFERFFTTKPEGMGVGLSICRSIIEAHGGTVWAANNAGCGATFAFNVPAISKSVE